MGDHSLYIECGLTDIVEIDDNIFRVRKTVGPSHPAAQWNIGDFVWTRIHFSDAALAAYLSKYTYITNLIVSVWTDINSVFSVHDVTKWNWYYALNDGYSVVIEDALYNASLMTVNLGSWNFSGHIPFPFYVITGGVGYGPYTIKPYIILSLEVMAQMLVTDHYAFEVDLVLTNSLVSLSTELSTGLTALGQTLGNP